MIKFQSFGHQVYLLTHEPKGQIHEAVEKKDVLTYFHHIRKKNALFFYIKHVFQLNKFIKRNNIDIIYAHTQPANLIAVFAQYLNTSRLIICRHHSDLGFVDKNFNAKLVDKIINRLGKEFIVPSKKVYDQMILEGVSSTKIRKINYGYDFSLYPSPDPVVVKKIKELYSSNLLLIMVGRLVKAKGYFSAFNTIKRLRNEGINIKLIIIGEGPDKREFMEYIEENELGTYIFFIGFKKNVMDYLSAADLLIHLSDSEASSNVVKEAGLLGKTAVVCQGVGDFDDYIINRKNGFFIDIDDKVNNLVLIIKEVYLNKAMLLTMGINLYHSVIEHFSVETVMRQYAEIPDVRKQLVKIEERVK